MDKRMKARWVKALRSGDYTQTTGTLYKKVVGHDIPSFYDTHYCVIGVAVRIKDPYSFENSDQHFTRADINYFLAEHTYVRPERLEEIIESLHLSDEILTRLIQLNDVEKRNFNQIADWIEENV